MDRESSSVCCEMSVGMIMSWVAVARSEDLLNGMAMPGRVEGTDLALWRSAAGHVHAWGDRCPHRGMRLSHGFVRGETLACIYHGWQYDDAGACAAIPAHPDLVPPKTICATTYDCAENGGLIWVTLNDPSGSIPDMSGLRAIRSIEVLRDAAEIADFFGQPVDALIRVVEPQAMTLALQPVGEGRAMIHVLAAKDHDPRAISQASEALRSQLEEDRA